MLFVLSPWVFELHSKHLKDIPTSFDVQILIITVRIIQKEQDSMHTKVPESAHWNYPSFQNPRPWNQSNSLNKNTQHSRPKGWEELTNIKQTTNKHQIPPRKSTKSCFKALCYTVVSFFNPPKKTHPNRPKPHPRQRRPTPRRSSSTGSNAYWTTRRWISRNGIWNSNGFSRSGGVRV